MDHFWCAATVGSGAHRPEGRHQPGKFTYVRGTCVALWAAAARQPLLPRVLAHPHVCCIKVWQWAATPEPPRLFPGAFGKTSGCLQAKRRKIKVRVK